IPPASGENIVSVRIRPIISFDYGERMAADRHRVLVIGGGFGGLFATRVLRRAPVEVTLLDRVNHHLFQPLLYQVATGILSEGQIAPPIRIVERRQRTAQVALAEVTAF